MPNGSKGRRLLRTEEAYAIGEVLGKEHGCMYCEKEVHAISPNKSYFIIKGSVMRFFSEEKMAGAFRIRRYPVCGKRLE